MPTARPKKKKKTSRASTPAKASKAAIGRAPRRYASAEPTMQKILTAAELVLIRDGYHALSTRRVAAESAVSLGHLTYYYPTKNELVRAMITAVMSRYNEQIRNVPAALDTSAGGDARVFIAWLMRDTVTDETSGLFRELWVMAKHDRFVAGEVLRFYEGLMESFVEILAKLHPTADRLRLQQLAHLIGMLSEGGTVLFAGPGERSVTHEDMVKLVVEVFADQMQKIIDRSR